MRSVGKWSVQHRVTANLLMVFVFVLGIMGISGMKREVFPQFSLDMITIEVAYPGADPEEVEEGISVCPGLVYEKEPSDAALKVQVEEILNDRMIQVVWREDRSTGSE